MIDARLLRPKQSGEPIRAEDWNAIIELLKREVRGPNVIADNLGWLLVDPVAEGGGTSSLALMFGEVQSASGTTPPYLYALRQVTHSSGYTFGSPYGIDVAEAYNLAEIGASGTGVAPIPVDDIVMFWQTSSGGYVFDRHWYRGTYG